MEAITYALNLLPDEKFSAFDAVLFDPKADPEILDAIFSDALNRADSIKYPAMKKIVAIPSHPMAFESARILDAIGAE